FEPALRGCSARNVEEEASRRIGTGKRRSGAALPAGLLELEEPVERGRSPRGIAIDRERDLAQFRCQLALEPAKAAALLGAGIGRLCARPRVEAGPLRAPVDRELAPPAFAQREQRRRDGVVGGKLAERQCDAIRAVPGKS